MAGEKNNKDKKTTASSSDEAQDLETVLEKLSLDLLKEYMQGNNIKGKKSTKKAAVDSILEDAQKKGEKEFIKLLEKEPETLKLALEEFDVKVTGSNKSKMKSAFEKLFKKSEDKEEFFNKCSLELLTKFLEALGMEEDSSKEEKAEAVMEEILIAGLKAGFSTMAKEFISDVCKALDVPSSGSKKVCIARIIGLSFPHYLDTVGGGKEEKQSNDISNIKDGVDFTELYQYYTEELQEYCKQNGLKKTGSKKELCKRILKFLAGDTETTKPMKPGQRRNKKRGQKRKKEGEEGEGEKKEGEEGEAKEGEEKEKKTTKKATKKTRGRKKKTAEKEESDEKEGDDKEEKEEKQEKDEEEGPKTKKNKQE
ncbi:hypothetical protein ABK040_003250 [Willaertia magna]